VLAMSSLDANIFLTHEEELSDGIWVIDRVTYSVREDEVIPLLIVVSVVSLVAVLGLIVVLGIAAWETRKSETRSYFFRTNVAVYFWFLLLSDIIQSIGSIMNAKWVGMSAVQSGNYCTAQGVIKHIADISCGGWSLVIAVHTFAVMFYQVHSPRWVMWLTVVCINGYMVFMCFLGPLVYKTGSYGKPNFYGISGYWCWISDEYNIGQITMDYLAMFVSAFFSLVLYFLVFLRMRGNIVVVGRYVSWRWNKDSEWGSRHVDDRALVVAKQMLLYPVGYSFVIIPIAAARFSEWTGHTVPFAVTIFCDCVFLLSGLINVVLFCITRKTSVALPSRRVLSRVITIKRFNKTSGSGQTITPEATIATFANANASLLPDSKQMSWVSMQESTSRSKVTCPTTSQGTIPPPPCAPDRDKSEKPHRIPRKPPPALKMPVIDEIAIPRPHGSRHPMGPRAMSRPFSPPGSTRPVSRLQFLAKLSPKLFTTFHQHSGSGDPLLNGVNRGSGLSSPTMRDIGDGVPEMEERYPGFSSA